MFSFILQAWRKVLLNESNEMRSGTLKTVVDALRFGSLISEYI